MWTSIKANWGQLTVLTAILAGACGAYVEWRIKENVDLTVSAQGFAKPSDVDKNTVAIARLEKDAEKLDTKIEKIIDILIE